MGRRLVILAVFMAVFIAGQAAFTHPVRFAAAYAEATEVGGKSQAKAKESGADGAHPEYEYVQVPPIILPVITSAGLTQQVSLKVQLEVPWGDKDKISAYSPRLVDAYLQDLYGALSAGSGLLKNSFINVSAVKQRLSTDTDKVLGKDKDKVHDVLLQVLQQRPL